MNLFCYNFAFKFVRIAIYANRQIRVNRNANRVKMPQTRGTNATHTKAKRFQRISRF